jgi:hypothetical protein
MTATSKHTSDDDASDGSLAWLTEDAPEVRRTTTRSFRLSPSECERIDRAAAGVGMTTSAYLRSRVLGPGPDVAAWRRTYELVVQLEAEAEDRPASSERVGELKAALEEIALGVLPGDGD